MAKLSPPSEVIRKVSDWGNKKWHFTASVEEEVIIRTTCNVIFSNNEIERELVQNIDADDVCQKCLGAMTIA